MVDLFGISTKTIHYFHFVLTSCKGNTFILFLQVISNIISKNYGMMGKSDFIGESSS